LELIDGLREMVTRADALDPGDPARPSVGEIVEAVLARTGYRGELEASSDPQDGARLDNLNELVSVATSSVSTRSTRPWRRPMRPGRAPRTRRRIWRRPWARRIRQPIRPNRPPVRWPRSWKGSRWSPTPTRSPTTRPGWSR